MARHRLVLLAQIQQAQQFRSVSGSALPAGSPVGVPAAGIALAASPEQSKTTQRADVTATPCSNGVSSLSPPAPSASDTRRSTRTSRSGADDANQPSRPTQSSAGRTPTVSRGPLSPGGEDRRRLGTAFKGLPPARQAATGRVRVRRAHLTHDLDRTSRQARRRQSMKSTDSRPVSQRVPPASPARWWCCTYSRSNGDTLRRMVAARRGRDASNSSSQ